jgi:protein phosphatase methylesterase 1
MSNLYRSAISARLAKLPPDVPIMDEDNEEEETDGLGSLPSAGGYSGMGPPAMQVIISAS